MSNTLRAVISAALLAVPFCVLAQEPVTPAQPDAALPPESAIRSGDPSTGNWKGEWQCSESCRSYGSMEMEIDVNGDQVTGKVRSTSAPYKNDCSREWEKVAGVRKGEKIFAQYNYGGRCGKVDLIYAIDAEGRNMTGTWSSQWPSNGTFSLKRTTSTGVSQ
jgi:hypothetical protein